MTTKKKADGAKADPVKIVSHVAKAVSVIVKVEIVAKAAADDAKVGKVVGVKEGGDANVVANVVSVAATATAQLHRHSHRRTS